MPQALVGLATTAGGGLATAAAVGLGGLVKGAGLAAQGLGHAATNLPLIGRGLAKAGSTLKGAAGSVLEDITNIGNTDFGLGLAGDGAQGGGAIPSTGGINPAAGGIGGQGFGFEDIVNSFGAGDKWGLLGLGFKKASNFFDDIPNSGIGKLVNKSRDALDRFADTPAGGFLLESITQGGATPDIAGRAVGRTLGIGPTSSAGAQQQDGTTQERPTETGLPSGFAGAPTSTIEGDQSETSQQFEERQRAQYEEAFGRALTKEESEPGLAGYKKGMQFVSNVISMTQGTLTPEKLGAAPQLTQGEIRKQRIDNMTKGFEMGGAIMEVLPQAGSQQDAVTLLQNLKPILDQTVPGMSDFLMSTLTSPTNREIASKIVRSGVSSPAGRTAMLNAMVAFNLDDDKLTAEAMGQLLEQLERDTTSETLTQSISEISRALSAINANPDLKGKFTRKRDGRITVPGFLAANAKLMGGVDEKTGKPGPRASERTVEAMKSRFAGPLLDQLMPGVFLSSERQKAQVKEEEDRIQQEILNETASDIVLVLGPDGQRITSGPQGDPRIQALGKVEGNLLVKATITAVLGEVAGATKGQAALLKQIDALEENFQMLKLTESLITGIKKNSDPKSRLAVGLGARLITIAAEQVPAMMDAVNNSEGGGHFITEEDGTRRKVNFNEFITFTENQGQAAGYLDNFASAMLPDSARRFFDDAQEYARQSTLVRSNANLLAYTIAGQLFGQTGRGLSDFDVRTVQRALGSDADTLSMFAALDNLMDESYMQYHLKRDAVIRRGEFQEVKGFRKALPPSVEGLQFQYNDGSVHRRATPAEVDEDDLKAPTAEYIQNLSPGEIEKIPIEALNQASIFMGDEVYDDWYFNQLTPNQRDAIERVQQREEERRGELR